MEMKRFKSNFEVISGLVPDLKDKTIIDVGCGVGDLVRDLTKAGAQVTGIDTAEILVEAKRHPLSGNERYVEEQGEKLPFENDYADIIVYFASFHHFPVPLMSKVLAEVGRVLKTGGTAVFVEPVGRKGSYFEITKLVGDEREIQRLAYREIKNAHTYGLEIQYEEMCYAERSYENYTALLNIYVKDEQERNDCLEKARKKTEKFSQKAGVDFNDYRYKSICRVNVLRKL